MEAPPPPIGRLYRLILLSGLLAAGVLAACGDQRDSAVESEAVATAGFVGSGECRRCHERFFELWAPSHHGLAMQVFTPEFAEARLLPHTADLPIGQAHFRVDVQAGQVRETGARGNHTYRIQQVLGGKNVYYLLTPLERGRLQVLPVAFDVRRREWFNTTASMVRHFTDQPDAALDWREQPLTFNTSCYGCHVSQLSTNYDLATDSYHTAWMEPGVNCETCHGPAAEHVRVCDEAPEGETPADLKIIRTTRFSVGQTNALCAPCHAKMQPLTSSLRPGDDFFQHFDLVTLEDPDFYPDGRDLGENYTYTGWLMSPCARSGQLDCVHCHTSSGRYRFAEERYNDACRPCHQDHVEDPEPHTHHPAASEGGRCIACHMPRTEFARMMRSDHSMRPPAPAATIAFQSPNACTLCHTNRTPEWADRLVRSWRKRDYQAPILRRASLIAAARKQDWSRLPDMLEEIGRADRDEVTATSLIRLLFTCEDPRKGPAMLRALADPSPLVRSAAALALDGYRSQETLEALLAATTDSVRLVRLRAAMSLVNYPAQIFTQSQRQQLDRALHEYESSLQTRLDHWTAHYNLGNYFVNLGRAEEALSAFETASRLQPGAVAPLTNAAIVLSGQGRDDEAEASLRRALAIEPRNATVNLNLGLLLGGSGRIAEAEAALRSALEADPALAMAAFNLGVLLADRDLSEALSWCRRAAELSPDVPRYGYTYGFYLYRSGDLSAARRVLTDLITRHTTYADAYLLLGAVFEDSGRPVDAIATYREALSTANLTDQDRIRLGARIQALAR